MPPRYESVEGVRDLLSRHLAEQEDLEDGDADTPSAEGDSAASLSDRALERRLVTAGNQVDASLSPYYPTPFSSGDQPGLVDDLTEAIAAYLATLTDLQSGELDNDPVRLRYAWATEQLGAIAKGDVELPGVDRKSSPTAGAGAIAGAPRNPNDGRLFRPEELGLATGRAYGSGWVVE